MVGPIAIPDGGGSAPTGPANCGPVDANAAVDRVLDQYGSGNATRQLLEELGNCCDPQQAQAILDELQRREPDAWTSIVSTSQLAALQGSGYSQAGLTNLADALASKQAGGTLSEDELIGIFGSGLAGTERAQNIGSQMLFSASNSQQMQGFEAFLANKAMDLLANADRNSASHGTDIGAAGWANNIISGLGADSSSRQAIFHAYVGRDAGQRQHIRELLGDKESVGYEEGPDALACLIKAVAEATSPMGSDGTNLAVEMANWAGDNRDFFAVNDMWGSRTSDPRADALGLLLVTNHQAILDDLTDGYTNPDQYAGDDGKRLGFLLSLTAYNPNNAFQASVTSRLNAYTDRLVEQVRQDPAAQAAQEPLGRLEILSPALMIANAAPYLGNLESNEARVNGILRVLDQVTTAVSWATTIVPTGRFASFLIAAYGSVNGLSDSQIRSALGDFLTQAMSGSEAEREQALSEIAGMVSRGIEAQYGDVPVVAGAMTRRIEDTTYAMLLAIANNDVGGFLETYHPG